VKVDKQISCDGGATWSDAAGFESANGDGSNGCIGFAGVAATAGTAGIMTRYAAQNISDSGIALTSCTIGETNVALGTGITTTFGIANNGSGGGASTQSTGFALTGEPTTPVECSAATPGSEPDTANVSCTCNVPLLTQPTVAATDSATFGCCGVQIDKQVSCNGGAFTDVAFETANGDGTNGCSALNGQSVAFKYVVHNTGTTTLSCLGSNSQGLVDTYVATAGVQFSTDVTTVVGTDSTFTPTATTCSNTLNTNEASGDKAAISCTCSASAVNGTDVTVSAFDIAKVQCGSATFTSVKACTPTTAGATTFTSDVTVNNTGSVQESCSVVDQVVAGACGTAPACAAITGNVTMSPNPLVVAAGLSGDSTGSLTAVNNATSCNQACVTCTPAGGAALAPQVDQANCPIGTCFSRTPGYWGTHPQVTQTLLPLTVCGITLTTTTADVANSATEDLCGTGGPEFKPNGTSPQQLQLIRQCTAAALVALERACDIAGARMGSHQHTVEQLAQPIIIEAAPRQTDRRSVGTGDQPQLGQLVKRTQKALA
jgi:hypothetical protein